LIEKNPREWNSFLKYALWVDRTRMKIALGNSPFQLVYGVDPILPVNLKIPTLQFAQDYLGIDNKQEVRLLQLMHLEEKRSQAIDQFAKHQAVVKRWFDKRARIKAFRISDLVLMWDKAHERKGDHGKFDRLWIGPFQISEILGDSTYRLKNLTGEDVPLPVNGQFLKHYFQA